jgi:preprotein translocase subunit YajC
MTNILFAQESVPAAQSGGMMQTFIMLVLFAGFFWFIIYSPQKKKQKKDMQMRETLKKGDAVTAMAIVGVIEKVNTDTIVISTAGGTKIELLKGAITEVIPPVTGTVE